MNKKALVYIIMAGILWGTSGIFVNIWSSFDLSPMQITAFRSIFSALCFWLYAALFDKKSIKVRVKDLPYYAGSGATLLGTAAFYYSSMQATSISTAVVLMYMAPILVLGWSVAFFGEKFNMKKGAAVLCMLIGCGFVSGIVGGIKFDTLGIIFGLASAVSYGIYNILTKIEMRKGCNPITATLYSFLFAAVFAVILNPVEPLITLVESAPAKIIPLAIAHALTTFVIPYFLYTLALKKIPAGVASALAILEPMSATIFSVVLFHEKLSVFAVIGIVMILGAVLALSKEEA